MNARLELFRMGKGPLASPQHRGGKLYLVWRKNIFFFFDCLPGKSRTVAPVLHKKKRRRKKKSMVDAFAVLPGEGVIGDRSPLSAWRGGGRGLGPFTLNLEDLQVVL